MPIYDYVCRSCGNVLEVIHGVHVAGPSECPVCGGEMRRAVSAAAVVFKGSGWAKKERNAKASSSATKDGEASKPGTDSSTTPAAEPGKTPAAESTTKSSASPTLSESP